jgi:2-octaprenyl-6-methoxyphenol hydroxylase
VIVGNAAHSLHPIAGQGFNLSLRDVTALAETIEKALYQGQALGSLTVLQEYAAWRQRDQKRTMIMTQGLIDIFASHFSPLIIARDLGLAVLDIAQPLKRYFTRATMGLSGRLPRLALNNPLPLAGERPGKRVLS